MQHAIRPADGPIKATLTIPGSKAITQRALLIAALADGVSELSGAATDEDTQSLINALHQVGVVVQLDEDENTCIVAGGAGRFPKNQTNIWCTQSLATTYFMLAGCAASTGVYYLDGTPDLQKINLKQMLEVLCALGCQLIPGDASNIPVTIIGTDTFNGGNIKLDHITNDIISSAMLILAPYAKSPITLLLNNLDSHPDINMTASMMADFGVLVQQPTPDQLVISAPQRYHAHDHAIEPDYEIANYFFAAAAITGGEITIKRMKHKLSRQPGLQFLSVLEKMGCHVNASSEGLTVSARQQLNGIDVGLRSFSSSFLTLTAIAPFASSPTTITHSGQITDQESALLNSIAALLTQMSIQVETGSNWIKIYSGNPKTIHVKPNLDPRIAMAFSLIGLKVPDVKIEDAECVINVYPKFFEIWDQLTQGRSIKT